MARFTRLSSTVPSTSAAVTPLPLSTGTSIRHGTPAQPSIVNVLRNAAGLTQMVPALRNVAQPIAAGLDVLAAGTDLNMSPARRFLTLGKGFVGLTPTAARMVPGGSTLAHANLAALGVPGAMGKNLPILDTAGNLLGIGLGALDISEGNVQRGAVGVGQGIGNIGWQAAYGSGGPLGILQAAAPYAALASLGLQFAGSSPSARPKAAYYSGSERDASTALQAAAALTAAPTLGFSYVLAPAIESIFGFGAQAKKTALQDAARAEMAAKLLPDIGGAFQGVTSPEGFRGALQSPWLEDTIGGYLAHIAQKPEVAAPTLLQLMQGWGIAPAPWEMHAQLIRSPEDLYRASGGAGQWAPLLGSLENAAQQIMARPSWQQIVGTPYTGPLRGKPAMATYNTRMNELIAQNPEMAGSIENTFVRGYYDNFIRQGMTHDQAMAAIEGILHPDTSNVGGL